MPWRLVTLIREFASKFSVLVPHRAFSAATLTVLGADELVMHPMGMLGPTDPTVVTPYNPVDPSNPNRRLGIDVEDVAAYLNLIKDDAGIQHQDQLIEAFNKLAENVHPLALGHVKRSLLQSRMMAKKLLSLHMDPSKQAHRIEEIVESFTSKLFYHGHPINRGEARDELGLSTVADAPLPVEKAMWDLYLAYEREMQMTSPFRPALEFVEAFPGMNPEERQITKPKTQRNVVIESEKLSHVFTGEYCLSGQMNPQGVTHVTTIWRKQRWGKE